MTAHDHGPHSGHRAHLHAGQGADEKGSPFSELMGEVMATAERFGHRQHLQLTWLAVRRYGTSAAVDVVSDGIQSTTRYAGAPQKYNATVSRAWVELVGYHADQSDAPDFDAFTDQYPALLDKRLLNRFYHSATLASPQARTGWIEPDVAGFPWYADPTAQPGGTGDTPDSPAHS
ncbi:MULTISPECIES: hypothetical protein [unclassified Streptomyces]|uniref:hypothetical protein n=1 Tax=unclassified Streptomyces TaxID=2593676 RepID=UPI000B2C7F40|nr:hypothetical protein [Streptomyces sp. CNQ-509]